MKTDRWDPPRIDSSAPEALQDFVRGVRGRKPDAAAFERMSKRLVSAAEATPSPSGVRRDTRLATYGTVTVAALMLAGAGLLSWRATRQQTPTTTIATVATAGTAATRVAEPAAAVPAQSALVVPGPEASAASAPNATSVDELPSAPNAAAREPSQATPAASTRPSTPELQLLKRAQAALATDPERALAVTGEQARLYPSGEFVQEREVIAVEALARLGRREESLVRARALVRRFPLTPYATRLEMAVGLPVTSPLRTAPPAESETRPEDRRTAPTSAPSP